MNARIFLTLTCAAAVLPATASASKPPVKVEVLVDGDDGEDFFEDDASAADSGAPGGARTATVRDRADDMFEEIDQTQGVKVRTKRTGVDGKKSSSSTQVVNVIVQGTDEESKVKPVVPGEANASTQGPPAPDCDCEVKTRRRHRWWRVPNHVQRGDFMLSMSGGWSNAGGLIGLRLEGMPSRSLGIQLKFHATGFGREDLEEEDRDIPLLTSGEWGLDEIDPRFVERGFAHITDLGIAWHIFNTSRFDLHPTLAISHFGYDIDVKTGPAVQGGSLLARFGLALNYHWRRIFAGFDFGWYPLEILRYERVENADGDREFQNTEIRDRFNERRFTSSAHIGFRF